VSEWIELRLGEVCSRLSSGTNITAKDIHEAGSFPVFGGNGIRGYAAEANFSGECAIIGRQGAYCGNVRYFIGEARMSEHAIVAYAGPSHHTRFLAYLLSNMNLGSLSGQAAQPGLSVKVLAQQSLRMPSRQDQARIAEILGAYDDLIEVNRRRVAVLEEMARGLFEEWFVRFRFPGHESVPLVDTPDSPLPQGWDRKTVEEVTSFISRGIAPKYSEDSETLVVNQKCIRDGRVNLALARRQTKTPPVAKLVQVGDVLINSTGVGTLGRVAQAEEVPEGLTVDSHVTLVRPERQEDRDYLGLLLLNLQPIFEHLGAGSTGQTELSRHAVGAQVVSWAPPTLRMSFGRTVRPMRSLVVELLKQNERLASSRDLLLPRLISGQLSVEAAERDLELAA
jgi:type I restriction enzyme S subunit